MVVSRTFSFTGPILALLLGLGIAACDGPTDTGRPPVTLSITPSEPLSLTVGDTVTVRTTVQNAARPTVRFATSTPAVASVSENGLVQALSPGEATITATSVQDPRATASLVVRVSPRRLATITIQGITSLTGVPIDPRNVQGTITVRLSVEPHNATAAEVLLGDSVACRRPLGSASAASATSTGFTGEVQLAGSGADLSCTFNTAEIDSATATPRFRNGPVRMSARLVTADGTVLYRDQYEEIRLANPNSVLVRLASAPSATDAAGLRWITGPAVITAAPVLYEPSVGLRSVTFVYGFPGGVTQTKTDTVAPYQTVFPDSFPNPAALRGLVDPAFEIRVNTVTTAGTPGPSGVMLPVPYDNAPPTPGALVARPWIGLRTAFTEVYDRRNESDRGVGRVRVRFYAGDFTLSTAEIIRSGTAVTSGSDLKQVAQGAYRLAATVCDALENCTPLEGFRFGVDLTSPTVERVSLADRSINPTTGSITLDPQDDLSGFDARPVEATTTLLNATGSFCGPTVDGIDLPGHSVTGGGCAPDSVGTVIPIPPSTQGYYTYTLTPFDRAGNRATTVTRTILVDRTAPTVGGIVLPGGGLPGEEGTFRAVATDNLDLTEIGFRLVFRPGGVPIAIPFDTASAVVGAPFDARLTTEETRTARFPVIRTLTVVSPARSTSLVDSLQVRAVDAAGLTAAASSPVTPAVYGGNQSTTEPPQFTPITAADVRLDANVVCTRNCRSGEKTTLNLDLRITGTSALNQPFATVYFYRRDVASGLVTFIGSVSALDHQGNLGAPPTFVYPQRPFTFVPPSGLSGTFRIFAVGVRSIGDAFATNVTEGPPVEFFARTATTP